MLNRITTVAILACVLGGCTDADWDHTFSYVGIGDKPSATAAPAPVTSAAPLAPQNDPWCESAAKAAAQESREQGFDEATQRHQADAARRQCQHN